MIGFAATLGQLRDLVNKWIEGLGEDAPLGTLHEPEPPDAQSRAGAVMEMGLQLEWVNIDALVDAQGVDVVEFSLVAGDEANDDELGPGQREAVLIT